MNLQWSCYFLYAVITFWLSIKSSHVKIYRLSHQVRPRQKKIDSLHICLMLRAQFIDRSPLVWKMLTSAKIGVMLLACKGRPTSAQLFYVIIGAYFIFPAFYILLKPCVFYLEQCNKDIKLCLTETIICLSAFAIEGHHTWKNQENI